MNISLMTSHKLWIKSISNESDINFCVCTLPLLHHIMLLWCHQQLIVMSSAECKRSQWNNGVNVWRSFLSSFMDLLSCKKLIMYVLLWLFTHSLDCSFGVYFPHCFASWEINKITLLWVHEQFATGVHTSFYIYIFPVLPLAAIGADGYCHRSVCLAVWTSVRPSGRLSVPNYVTTLTL